LLKLFQQKQLEKAEEAKRAAAEAARKAEEARRAAEEAEAARRAAETEVANNLNNATTNLQNLIVSVKNLANTENENTIYDLFDKIEAEINTISTTLTKELDVSISTFKK
jgi:3-oxoacyl-ACP reductase-like protein